MHAGGGRRLQPPSPPAAGAPGLAQCRRSTLAPTRGGHDGQGVRSTRLLPLWVVGAGATWRQVCRTRRVGSPPLVQKLGRWLAGLTYNGIGAVAGCLEMRGCVFACSLAVQSAEASEEQLQNLCACKTLLLETECPPDQMCCRPLRLHAGGAKVRARERTRMSISVSMRPCARGRASAGNVQTRSICAAARHGSASRLVRRSRLCCGNRRAGREHGSARAIPHSRQARSAMLAFFEAVLFALIEEISLRTAQVDDFRAAVAVLLLHRALFAVERIRHAHSPADNASAFVRAVVALVANPNHRARPARRTRVRIRRGIARARARNPGCRRRGRAASRANPTQAWPTAVGSVKGHTGHRSRR